MLPSWKMDRADFSVDPRLMETLAIGVTVPASLR